LRRWSGRRRAARDSFQLRWRRLRRQADTHEAVVVREDLGVPHDASFPVGVDTTLEVSIRVGDLA
jgi:hypothetical protein